MSTFAIKLFAAFFLSWAYIGCASKPPRVEPIASSADPSTTIDRTEEMLQDAQTRQIDILSPNNFSDAKKSLEKAKKMRRSNKETNQDILSEVAISRAWLMEAEAKGEIAKASTKNLTDARAGALRAGAPRVYPKEWKKIEEKTQDVTEAIEKGNLQPAEKKTAELTEAYKKLELNSVRHSALSRAEENIKTALRDLADQRAPKTYQLALLKFRNAERVILADPRNLTAISRAAEDATKESEHLLEVNRLVMAGNTEDLVLTAEQQKRMISSLKSESQTAEGQLEQSKEQLDEMERQRRALALQQTELVKSKQLIEQADKIREKFKPNEAEVYVENDKVMIRLKALQFPTNKASLGPKNQALLEKVDAALMEIKPTKITVEGHTDGTGNPEMNEVLSELRARAVKEYFVRKGTFAPEQVDSIGKGTEEPIANNKTAYGRAQNRRVDLIVESTLE